MYLPPYSPNYNPIEECFSFVKAFVRQHGQSFRHIVELGDPAEPFEFLYAALDEVTAEVTKGWFQHCGYL